MNDELKQAKEKHIRLRERIGDTKVFRRLFEEMVIEENLAIIQKKDEIKAHTEYFFNKLSKIIGVYQHRF